MNRIHRCLCVALALAALTSALAMLPAAAGDTTWRGEYYANPSLSGEPALVRQDAEIDFDWGEDAPAPGLPIDDFSVRWTRPVSFDGGRYRFTTTTDDGVRLWVDGTLLIDHWRDMSATTFTGDIDLAAGEHTIRMEYYDVWSTAIARLSWVMLDSIPTVSLPAPLVDDWLGEYFNNANLVGSPVLVRYDPVIYFDWARGSPASEVTAGNFGVRWTRTILLQGGRYIFATQTQDGVRVWVNDQLIIDAWRSGGLINANNMLTLWTGAHRIRVEYFENTGTAIARFHIQPLDVPSAANLITYAPPWPSYSWIKVYQWKDGNWLDMKPSGYASISQDGRLKIDGLPVDYGRYGGAGHPYRVELWIDGQAVQSYGNFLVGEAGFRLQAGADNLTPWGNEVLAH